MKKTLRQVLTAVDPNLRIVSGHRRHKMTQADWDKAGGNTCPTCGAEIMHTHGPFNQCPKCFGREKGVYLEQTTCRKCKGEAALVSCLSDGLLDQKIICPNCGTYKA